VFVSLICVHLGDTTSIPSGMWRIAGWVGTVVFDGAVMVLTLFRAVRLRMSGIRVSIVDTMLRDGICYFRKYMFRNIKRFISYLTHSLLQS